ncbi:MAG: hypothetical protein ACRDJY_09475, partial [Thermoleophilaceae bacterium]
MPTRERIESPFGPSEPADTPPPAMARPPRARLALRGLTGWEEEYLEREGSEPNTARLCNEILARCLVAPGEN